MLEDILLIESQVKSMSKTSIIMNQIVKKNEVIITKAENDITKEILSILNK